MIKLNITLPSGAQVAIEADDKDLVREVLYSTMPHLNGVAEQPIEEVNGRSPDAPPHNNGTPTNGHGSAPPQMTPLANGADATRAVSNGASNGNHGHAPTATVASIVERPHSRPNQIRLRLRQLPRPRLLRRRITDRQRRTSTNTSPSASASAR